MTIDKLPSGSYRIRFSINGKRKAITIDHEPTKREAKHIVDDYLADQESKSEYADTFKNLANEYISAKNNVLSPNTKHGYKSCLDRLSQTFVDTQINDIDQLAIQREINRLAAKYSPKTVANTHGFISGIFRMYRPKMILNTTLPQKEKKDFYCPTDDDIKRILEMAKPTRYYVALCLGVMGMRRGEICALTINDLDGNTLTINKGTYTDENQHHGIKEQPKTTDSTRKIYISDELVERIKKDGCIYDGAESRLWAALQQFQEILSIPHFRFHDLRVYFATYAHLHNIPDKVIQDTAGWKSDYTMKKIYRKTQETENQKYQKDFLSQMGI